MAVGKTPVKLSARFVRDYKDLPSDLIEPVRECLRDIEKVPIPQTRRYHSVTPRSQKPTIFTVDVLSNHSWKLSFMRVGACIWVLRVAPHKEMDRDPGAKAAKNVLAEL